MERPQNEKENLQRIREVESCFGIDGQTLMSPDRYLVGEGNLTKVCRKRPKLRRFFLFNDILVYGNVVIENTKYNKQNIVPLEEIRIESLPDTTELTNSWLIKGKSKSFIVYAPTSDEKQKWIHYMNVCISQRLKDCGKDLEEILAPVWVPDNKAEVCMNCNMSKFSMINRRHHCRNCGKVVCDPCSNKRIPLPNNTKKEERVCQSCFEILLEENKDSVIPV